jgi:hypothetical protein
VPEAFLVLVAILAMLVHPFPLPYHLCLLVPFAYILGIRWALRFLGRQEERRSSLLLGASLIVFTHLVPFMGAAWRHLDFTNDRQEQLMLLAEQMTDPATDRVYDAAGLVASRESIGRQWFLHTTFVDKFARGEVPPVRTMLRDRPAAVLIPNYRFAWLQPEDVAFIQAHYLALSRDFMILGQALQPPQTDFACLHAGRYYISLKPGLSGTERVPLTLDGAPIPLPSVQYLSKGSHQLRAGKDVEVLVAWVGPTLDRVPHLAPGDSNRVFINWY